MTDKEAKAFYNSSAWKHKRMQILDRDHYECQDCRKRIKDAAASGTQLIGRDRKIWRAEEVHHIQELKEHPELGLDGKSMYAVSQPETWQSTEEVCEKEEASERREMVVPPGQFSAIFAE
mgnify:CR=1 FL=1